MTATKPCFGRDDIECYYLPLIEGKMRAIRSSTPKDGMMIRAKYNFLSEWNYDDNLNKTRRHTDSRLCTLRFNDRAIPSNTFASNTSWLAVFIGHFGRGGDSGSAQRLDDRSGRRSSGGRADPFRDGNRAGRD